MNKKVTDKLLKDIIVYCRKENYIKLITKQSKDSESARFDKKNIAKKGLDVLDTIRCLLDKKRTLFFIKEIANKVKKSDLVLEAGIGTGIFSYIAAMNEANVYGLEINKGILYLANKIKKYLTNTNYYKKYLTNNPIFYLKNATQYKPKLKFDVIISENIYTGMFYEKQVQIMNHLIKFLKPKGIVIPDRMISYFSLCEINPDLLKKKSSLIVVNDISNSKIAKYKLLSTSKTYSIINFSKKNDELLNYTNTIDINKGGITNGIYIKSNIYMPSGKIIKGSDTTFFGNDIIVPIKNPTILKKGDKVKVFIHYKYGNNPANMNVRISKV